MEDLVEEENAKGETPKTPTIFYGSFLATTWEGEGGGKD